jgi:hypothetical protein
MSQCARCGVTELHDRNEIGRLARLMARYSDNPTLLARYRGELQSAKQNLARSRECPHTETRATA